MLPSVVHIYSNSHSALPQLLTATPLVPVFLLFPLRLHHSLTVLLCVLSFEPCEQHSHSDVGADTSSAQCSQSLSRVFMEGTSCCRVGHFSRKCVLHKLPSDCAQGLPLKKPTRFNISHTSLISGEDNHFRKACFF